MIVGPQIKLSLVVEGLSWRELARLNLQCEGLPTIHVVDKSCPVPQCMIFIPHKSPQACHPERGPRLDCPTHLRVTGEAGYPLFVWGIAHSS